MNDRVGRIDSSAGSRPTLLVPGGTGFLGRHLVRALQSQYAITVLTRRPAGEARARLATSGTIDPTVEIITHDSFDLDKLVAQRRFVGIVYCAVSYGRGTTDTEVLQTNVEIPCELVELGERHGAELFVYVDTFFGKHSEHYDYLREYRASKKEAVARLQKRKGTIRIANLIIEHLYGSDDNPNKFIPNLLQKLSVNTPVIAMTPGEQRRDFVHVDDVVRGIEVVLQARPHIAPFCQFEIGTGQSHSIRELAELMRSITGTSSELRFGAEPYRPYELMESHADTRALQALGWAPRISFEQGIKSVCAAFASRQGH